MKKYLAISILSVFILLLSLTGCIPFVQPENHMLTVVLEKGDSNPILVQWGNPLELRWKIQTTVKNPQFDVKVELKFGEETSVIPAQVDGVVIPKDKLNKMGDYTATIIVFEKTKNLHTEITVNIKVIWGLEVGTNNPPQIELVSPKNEKDVPTFPDEDGNPLVTLVWNGSDPDGDTIAYDVYIKEANATEFAKILDHTFATQTAYKVEFGKEYEWYVDVIDPYGTITSSHATFVVRNNTAPQITVLATSVNNGVLYINWNLNDPENDDIYTYYTQIISGNSQQIIPSNIIYKKVEPGNYTVNMVAMDVYGASNVKTLNLTVTEETSDKATITLFFTRYNSGDYVDDVNIDSDLKFTEIASGVYQTSYTFGNNENSKTITVIATKTGFAPSKVEGLKIKPGDVIEYPVIIRDAQLYTDSKEEWLPDVDVITSLNGTALDVTIVATPNIGDHINIIYAAINKIPGAGFFGERMFTPDSTFVTAEFDVSEYEDEIALHVVVYDYNDSRVEVVKYINVNSKDSQDIIYTPFTWSMFGYPPDVESFTLRNALQFYSNKGKFESLNLKNNPFIKEFNGKEINILDVIPEFAPEDTNLFVFVYWIPWNLVQLGTEPLGYNVYRSTDGQNWKKIGYVSEKAKNNFLYVDHSPELEPGKTYHYAVSSVYHSGESNLTYLGYVKPLDTFNVSLEYPGMFEENVPLKPTFAWKPVGNLESDIMKDATYTYAMWIYDLNQSENHIVPIVIVDNTAYVDIFETTGPKKVSVNFDEHLWGILSMGGLYKIDKLEPHKSYSWGMDFAMAEKEFGVNKSYSIAVDYGYLWKSWNIDADVFNSFTTGIAEYNSLLYLKEMFSEGYDIKISYIEGIVVDTYSKYIFLYDETSGIKLKFSSNVEKVEIGDIVRVKNVDFYWDTSNGNIAAYADSFEVIGSGTIEYPTLTASPDELDVVKDGYTPVSVVGTVISDITTEDSPSTIQIEYDLTNGATASIDVYLYEKFNTTTGKEIQKGDKISIKGYLGLYKHEWEIILRDPDDYSKVSN